MQETLQRLNEGQREAFFPLARYCLGPGWTPEATAEIGESDDFLAANQALSEIDKATMVLLDGYAGTGKTYLINRLVEFVREENPDIKFGMTAPTNKAVKVLKSSSECKVSLDFGTIHSYLGLKEQTNWTTGERTFAPDFYKGQGVLKIQSIDVLIIDETSMLNKELFKFLKPHLDRGLKVIFMGDDKQIPPVGEVQSIPFLPSMRKLHNIQLISLSKIERQTADNPVVAYAAAIRNQYESSTVKFDFSATNNGETGIEVVSTDLTKLRPILVKYFCTDAFKANSDYMKVICWRNKTADYFNPIIRKLVFNSETLPDIMIGEKLIVESPIFEKREDNWDIIYTTNEELEVLSTSIGVVYLSYYLARSDTGKRISQQLVVKVYKAIVRVSYEQENKTREINIVHEDSREQYKALISNFATLANRCHDSKDRKELWAQHYNLQKNFADVGYNYCITAHKAQGSTYNFTLVHEWDIDVSRNVKERNRIRYVAATRARNKLFIVK